MLKAVIFDVGNVLLKWDDDPMYADLQKELGFSNEQLADFIHTYFTAFSIGEISEEDIWADAEKRFGIRHVSTDENLLGRTMAVKAEALHDVIELARGLKKRGFIIAILSNTIAAHVKTFTPMGVTEPFEHIFFSHELGMRKPDTDIYMHVLNELHVEPEEALFIDDKEENVESAKSLGIRTVHADNPGTIVEKVYKELRKDFGGAKAALIHDGKIVTILRDDKNTITNPDMWDLPGGGREGD